MTLSSIERYDSDRVSTVGDHAVVVGASIAGLCAARVLADAFERVTVLERDDLPDGPVERSGAPQGTQPHALMEAGRATLEDLFPGYSSGVLSAGGVLLDSGTDVDYYEKGGYLASIPRRDPAYFASRPLLEYVARERLSAVEGVTLRTGCRVTDYCLDETGTAVEGVTVREGAGGPERLPAGVVVDATGRTSHTPTWLADNGFAEPPVEEVEVDVGYSTAALDRPAGERRAVFAPASAPRRRGGVVFPAEDGRWLVNLHGVHGDHPPTDRAEFAEFADTLPTPSIGTLVDTYEWADGSVDYYPFPSNRRRYYEDLDRYPEGLLVTGDAVASFNPIYGQGMSVAAMDALALHHALAAGTDSLASRYFDRVSSVVDIAWLMAVGADAQYAETTGEQPRGSALFDRYLSRLKRKAHTDASLSAALVDVITMQRPPSSLLRPTVAARVLAPDLPSLAPAGRLASAQSWLP